MSKINLAHLKEPIAKAKIGDPPKPHFLTLLEPEEAAYYCKLLLDRADPTVESLFDKDDKDIAYLLNVAGFIRIRDILNIPQDELLKKIRAHYCIPEEEREFAWRVPQSQKLGSKDEERILKAVRVVLKQHDKTTETTKKYLGEEK